MKKKAILMILAAVLVLGVGGYTAALTYRTYGEGDTKTNVSTKTLEIDLSRNTKEIENNKMPGDTVDDIYNVSNTGTTDMYVKVVVNKSWAAGKDKENPTDAGLMTFMAGGQKIEYASGYQTIGDWIYDTEDLGTADGCNHEQITAYYTKPLAVGQTTSDVIDQLALSSDISNSDNTDKIEVESEAYGVQYLPGSDKTNSDAISSVWGMDVSIGSDGSITLK